MGKVIGVITAWILGQLISFVVELQTFGAVDQTTWYTLTHPQIAETTSSLGVITGFVNGGWDWLVALGDMLTWNYAFFQGWLQIFRFVILIPLTVGFFWMIISLLRGASSD